MEIAEDKKRLYAVSALALLCVICLGALIWVKSSRAQLSPKSQKYIAEKMSGWSSEGDAPDAYARRVLEIQERFREGHNPGPKEIREITRGLSGNSHEPIKVRALVVLETFVQHGVLPERSRSEVVDSALPFLRSDDLPLRVRATILLGRVGEPRAAPSIIPLRNDPEPLVRERAEEALGKLQTAGR